MIRSIIIDDEKACIDSLAFEIKNHCPEIEVLETCSPKSCECLLS